MATIHRTLYNVLLCNIENTSVCPRKVVKEALRLDTMATILVHNHPA
ncbi:MULTISPECIES: JAB domain-containing protein [Raoultella]|nr:MULTISPECIES: JAB domain-containing protein [Raoultella]